MLNSNAMWLLLALGASASCHIKPTSSRGKTKLDREHAIQDRSNEKTGLISSPSPLNTQQAIQHYQQKVGPVCELLLSNDSNFALLTQFRGPDSKQKINRDSFKNKLPPHNVAFTLGSNVETILTEGVDTCEKLHEEEKITKALLPCLLHYAIPLICVYLILWSCVGPQILIT